MTLEEIQEMLANFENRISFLENSLLGSAMSYHPEEENQEVVMKQLQEPWSKKQWNIVDQLRGEMINLKRKFLDLEALVT
ncbi:unnamed protein product, partial [marine sediment metagenome]